MIIHCIYKDLCTYLSKVSFKFEKFLHFLLSDDHLCELKEVDMGSFFELEIICSGCAYAAVGGCGGGGAWLPHPRAPARRQ